MAYLEPVSLPVEFMVAIHYHLFPTLLPSKKEDVRIGGSFTIMFVCAFI